MFPLSVADGRRRSRPSEHIPWGNTPKTENRISSWSLVQMSLWSDGCGRKVNEFPAKMRVGVCVWNIARWMALGSPQDGWESVFQFELCCGVQYRLVMDSLSTCTFMQTFLLTILCKLGKLLIVRTSTSFFFFPHKSAQLQLDRTGSRKLFLRSNSFKNIIEFNPQPAEAVLAYDSKQLSVPKTQPISSKIRIVSQTFAKLPPRRKYPFRPQKSSSVQRNIINLRLIPI